MTDPDKPWIDEDGIDHSLAHPYNPWCPFDSCSWCGGYHCSWEPHDEEEADDRVERT